MVHAFQRIDEWRAARARAGRMLLALDFDGTLAPIVPTPDDATLLPGARSAIGRMLGRADTIVAVVSGRALEDVRRRVGYPGVHYAGNHGLEIEGPGVHRVHDEAEAAVARLAARARALRKEFAADERVLVEDKRLTLSIHFRLVEDAGVEAAIRRRVEQACAGQTGLRLTEGKKVVEIRPDVAWDKGRATSFLVGTLLGENGRAPVVYVGDDRTDEDAFVALRGRGEGVIVSENGALDDSAAAAWLRSPDEVVTLLARLAEP